MCPPCRHRGKTDQRHRGRWLATAYSDAPLGCRPRDRFAGRHKPAARPAVCVSAEDIDIAPIGEAQNQRRNGGNHRDRRRQGPTRRRARSTARVFVAINPSAIGTFGTVSIADIVSRAHLQNKKRVLRWTADPRVVDRTCSVLLDRAEVAGAGTTTRSVRLPTSQREAEFKECGPYGNRRLYRGEQIRPLILT